MDRVVANSREMIDKGSKSFGAAARLFDTETRESAFMLYAWCRHCDDVIDDQVLGQRSGNDQGSGADGAVERLAALYRDTRRAMAGERTQDPVFQAFQRVVTRHAIPHRYPLELLKGFGMDVRGEVYDSLEDTLRYCYHVAGVVGVMMAQIMGVKDSDTLSRASDMGIALQLTNIARDVVEDARVGRVYLPSQWLDAAGVPLDGVADPRHRRGVFEVVERLLGEAEAYYDSSIDGLPQLGFRSAWAVATARGVYRDIGRIVMERRDRAWDRRVVVGKGRKLGRAIEAGWIAVTANTLGNVRQPRPRLGLWTEETAAPAASPNRLTATSDDGSKGGRLRDR